MNHIRTKERLTAPPRLLRPLAALLTAALLLALLGGCAADVIEPSDYYYTYDSAGVLSVLTQTAAAEKGASLEKATGAKLVVVCVRNVGKDSIGGYAEKIFRQWKLTKNSFLLLLTLDDAQYLYVMGSALEARLPAGTLNAVLKTDFEPYFEAGDYDKGVRSVYDRMIAVYEKLYDVAVSPAAARQGGIHWVVILLIAVIVILVILWLFRRSSGSSGSTVYRPRSGGSGFGGYSGGYGGYSRPSSGGYGGYVSGRTSPPPRRTTAGPRPSSTPRTTRPGGGFGGGAPRGATIPSPRSGSSRTSLGTGSTFRPSSPTRSTPSHSGSGRSFGASTRSGGGSTRGGGAGRR